MSPRQQLWPHVRDPQLDELVAWQVGQAAYTGKVLGIYYDAAGVRWLEVWCHARHDVYDVDTVQATPLREGVAA